MHSSRVVHRARQNGAAILRQRILDGLSWTGTDPWEATEIAKALHVSPLSVRQALTKLAEEDLVVIVCRYPFTVRRVA